MSQAAFRLLVISDLHYAPASDPAGRECPLGPEMLRRVIEQSRQSGDFDAIALLGDMVNDGTAGRAGADLAEVAGTEDVAKYMFNPFAPGDSTTTASPRDVRGGPQSKAARSRRPVNSAHEKGRSWRPAPCTSDLFTIPWILNLSMVKSAISHFFCNPQTGSGCHGRVPCFPRRLGRHVPPCVSHSDINTPSEYA